jgi:hydroxymethylpyrimidine pyrophosphatase-like HAD family hydrolase
VGGGIAPRDSEAIRELARRNIPVTLCTGRMFSGTRPIALKLGISQPLACIDGSHIVDADSGRELASAPLCAEGVSSLIDALELHGPAAFVFSSDRVYFDGSGADYLPYVTTWSEHTEELSAVLDRNHWHAERPMAALVALGKQSQIEGVHGCLTQHEHLQSACFPVRRDRHDGVWGLIARAARVDKGTALGWLAAHYGIAVEEIVTVGDWLNDIPMLKCAGRSFAMKQAPEEVKAAATDVLEADAWSGGGIAEAAERAGLL